MKKYFLIIFLMLFGLFSSVTNAVWAPSDLAIIELKMTGSESIVLENTSSGTINLQDYLLQYYNSRSPANFNTPTDAQSLPNFSLAPGQSFLLAGDSAATCGAAGIASLGMSLSDTSGYIQVVKVITSGGTTTYTTQDHVNWTSSTTTPTDITQVPSTSVDPNAVWYRDLSSGAWSRYEIDTTPCNILVTVAPTSGTTYVEWASGSEPPATFTSTALDTSAIPAGDIGLAAPKINEILPNPAEPQSDDEDEFIELYNPNDTAFDLSGFKLQVGTTTLHAYTFPEGTVLPAKGFVAFYSIDTNLALSNSGGQVKLLDPLGNIISQTDVYGAAKDGQSWALANGQWYWTTMPTPNAANIINQPLTTEALNLGTTAVKKSKSSAAAKVKSATKSDKTATVNPSPPANSASVNPLILAGIGGGALLYAGYEYRHDLANQIYKFRRYRAARRAVGQAAKATDSSRVTV